MSVNLPNIGTESEKGVVAALDDLFGPTFRTVGEYLADKVRYHRLRSLKKILEKAKEFGPRGAEFIAPPPMKFLLPYIEAASLEDEDEVDISMMWAKLLADASTGFDAKQIHFIRILKEISSREARLLHAMATEYRGDHSTPNIFPGDYTAAEQFLARHHAQEFLEEFVGKIENNELAKEFVRRHENPGSRILYIHVGLADSDEGFWNILDGDEVSGRTSEFENLHGEITFELLRSVNLLEIIRCERVVVAGIGLQFDAYVMTKLGEDFYESCARPAFDAPVSSGMTS